MYFDYDYEASQCFSEFCPFPFSLFHLHPWSKAKQNKHDYNNAITIVRNIHIRSTSCLLEYINVPP